MKKSLILISFLVLILSLSSCKKNKSEEFGIDKGKKVNNVTIELEDKTIKLNNKMKGKELYQTLFQELCETDTVSFTFDQGKERGVRPCQAICEDNLLKKYKNDIGHESGKSVLINGADQYERTTVYNNYILDIKEDSSYKVFAEKTIDEINNVKGIKKENHSTTTVFGEETDILPTDEDYNPEYSSKRQYKDIVYYSSNETDTLQNGIYEKKYTSPWDYIDNSRNDVNTTKYFQEAYHSLSKYGGYQHPSITSNFSSIYNCYEWIDDYIQYGYELTDQYIILNYRALFDITSIYYDVDTGVNYTEERFKEIIEEDHKNGSYYEVIAYIDYHNENFAESGWILCDYLIDDWCCVDISKGKYGESVEFVGTEYEIYRKSQTKYTWKPLDITEAEIENKKIELINSLK
ncbi:MAG: hypothetical protein K2O05_01610 [Anaeroplasmataceae bacterium]|nr:hypothetical protein [Anaeroplasmataceae bacterium]